jgi:hypothetical protein
MVQLIKVERVWWSRPVHIMKDRKQREGQEVPRSKIP